MIQSIHRGPDAFVGEKIIMTVWPSIAMYSLGQLLGRAYSLRVGPYIFTLGNLFALLTIPIAVMLYFLRIAPVIGVRYTVTNRRVIVQKGLRGVDARWVDHDRFDRIEILVRPGQAWYVAGDLIFFREGIEVFRLAGVSRPRSVPACLLEGSPGARQRP